MDWIVYLIIVALGLWGVTRFYLRGEDLTVYDAPGEGVTEPPAEPSPQHADAVRSIGFMAQTPKGSRAERLASMRAMMDTLGDAADLDGVDVHPVDAGGVPGEWVVAGGSSPDRRLLYLHGGAFSMGSPHSHRVVTAKLSKIAGAAVLAIDYRLTPENGRLDCLADCQIAYRWILDNGPRGAAPIDKLFVAGDSAGGNLALVVIAWARDEGLRAADAAIAMSPATDSTFSGPSLRSNLSTDHMLGPAMGFIVRIPKGLMLWFGWLANRVKPSDPRVSPIHGGLANLPPTLVHASEAEMLLDDARRYVNKANAAGSPAVLQTWPHMLHVWHMFESTLPEAKDAFDHIEVFLEGIAPRPIEYVTDAAPE